MSERDSTESKWLSFEEAIREVRKSFPDLTAEQLQSLIDEALSAVRQGGGSARDDS